MSITLSPPRLRSTLPAVDIGDFFQAVGEALTLHLKTVDWPAGTQPTFVHDFPKERLARPDDPFDVITFHCGGAEMAPSSNDGSRVPRGPEVREKIPSTDKMGYEQVTLAWKEEVAVVFCIWSKSNKRADDMAAWFHRFMMRYGHVYQFFRARGVERFRFVQRGQDTVENQNGQEVYKRTLIYQIRIEYVDTVLEKQLEYVTINLGIKGGSETDSIERP